MPYWKMDCNKGCTWESNPVNNAMLEELPCVKEKGADETTCSECKFRKV